MPRGAIVVRKHVVFEKRESWKIDKTLPTARTKGLSISMAKNGAVLEIEQRLNQELNGDAWTGRMQRPEIATPPTRNGCLRRNGPSQRSGGFCAEHE
jgi:hypothetical protein